jgi:hypothetical protein
MAFEDDFNACMRPLPTPSEAFDSVVEVLHFLEKIHRAMEASGFSDEDAALTFGALVAAGAATGADEAVIEIAEVSAQTLVTTYVAACIACAVSSAGSAVVRAALASADDSAAKSALLAEADLQDQSAVA